MLSDVYPFFIKYPSLKEIGGSSYIEDSNKSYKGLSISTSW